MTTTELPIRIERSGLFSQRAQVGGAFESHTAHTEFLWNSDDATSKIDEVVFVVHPQTGRIVEIDPEQLWFWTPEWQAGERLVDEELRSGQYEEFDNMDDFLATL